MFTLYNVFDDIVKTKHYTIDFVVYHILVFSNNLKIIIFIYINAEK